MGTHTATYTTHAYARANVYPTSLPSTLDNTTFSRFKKKMYQCVTTAVDRVPPKAKQDFSKYRTSQVHRYLGRYLPSMYTVYRLDNTSASSPVDHKKIKKSAIEDADATSRPSKCTSDSDGCGFFLPYFVAGFM